MTERQSKHRYCNISPKTQTCFNLDAGAYLVWIMISLFGSLTGDISTFSKLFNLDRP